MSLRYNKLKVSKSSTSKLTVLKRRTGLTPNILCRIGLCLSLELSSSPPFDFDDNGMEFNRYTLTGEYDEVFVALLFERLRNDNVNIESEAMKHLKAHLNRGITLMHSRLKKITDLERLM